MVWSRDVSPCRTDTSQYRVLLIVSGVNHILSIDQCDAGGKAAVWFS